MGCTNSKMISGSRSAFNDAQQQQQPRLKVCNDRMSNANIQQAHRSVMQPDLDAAIPSRRTSDPSGPCDCGHKADVSEQILSIDTVATLFHALNEQHRSIVMNSTTQRNIQSDHSFEPALTAVFQVVLQYCELVTSIIGRDKIVSEPNHTLVMVTQTTISIMTAKTIIDLFDFVLYKSEESLWPPVYIASHTSTPSYREGDSDIGSPRNIDYAHDINRVLKIYKQMETMDFHVVHLGAICRRLQEIRCQISGDTAPRVTIVDGAAPSNDIEPQIRVSQHEAIDRALTAAASTRQEINRLREKINSSNSISQ